MPWGRYPLLLGDRTPGAAPGTPVPKVGSGEEPEPEVWGRWLEARAVAPLGLGPCGAPPGGLEGCRPGDLVVGRAGLCAAHGIDRCCV